MTNEEHKAWAELRAALKDLWIEVMQWWFVWGPILLVLCVIWNWGASE